MHDYDIDDDDPEGFDAPVIVIAAVFVFAVLLIVASQIFEVFRAR